MQFPEEPAEFAGNGYHRFVPVQASRRETTEPAVQPILRLPRNAKNLTALSGLPGRQLRGYSRVMTVMAGTLNEHPSGMPIAGFGYPSLPSLLPTGGFLGHHSEIPHQLPRMFEAGKITQFRDHRHRRHFLKTAKGHQGTNVGLSFPRG